MTSLLAQHGAQPQKPARSAPIYVSRTLTGLYTQRAALHDPSSIITATYYGGRPDALIDGSNVELTNRLTLARRPGLTQFSTTTYPTPPLRCFEFRLPDGTIQILVDIAGAIYLDNQNGTKTLIFTKSAGAGQSYFVSVGSVCYIGDGVDQIKYTPLNTNGTTWNWGIVAPTQPPGISTVASGANAAVWVASTVFTTMGLLVDGNGNMQSLVSVNASGTNTTQLGTTGNGQPVWNNTTGGTTSDNTVTWTCQGPVKLWAPNTAFVLEAPIWDPASNGIYQSSGGTTGGARPIFNGSGPVVSGNNRHVFDNGISWIYIGPAQTWKASHTYNSWWENSDMLAIEPVLPTTTILSGSQSLFLQTSNDAPASGYTNTPGTSGTGYTPPFSATAGNQTSDGDLIWVSLGSATWAPTTAYTQWFSGVSVFSALKDSNGNLQVCTTSGTSGSTQPLMGWFPNHAYGANSAIAFKFGTQYVKFTTVAGGTSQTPGPPAFDFTTGHTTLDGTITWTAAGTTTNIWGQSYGEQGNDGSVVWTCVGPAAPSWAASTQWFLPKTGFAPPTAAQPYGGATIIANGDVQTVIASGKSGASAPAWPAIGATVTDNTITWYTESAFSAGSLAWTIGLAYAYSYKCRTPNDTYVTTTPPGGTAPLGPYMGGGTGAISTASPAAIITGANTGAVNTISGAYSADPQVDTIVIFRSADGGGPSQMFELTEIANIPSLAGVKTWKFEDDLPSTATSSAPGLDIFQPAPIDHQNDPPPAGFLPMEQHFQRIWGAVENMVFFSGGPDVLTGNPNEAYNPIDEFPFLSTVTRLVRTQNGLLTFLTSDIEIISGGPATATFFSNVLIPGTGLLSYNALDVLGGEIYFFSSDGQFTALSPSLQITRAGFPIGDKLAAFNAANVYVAAHEAGIDNAVYVGDGATGWYRVNMHQVPEGEIVWSPFAAIVGGAKMVQSVEITKGVHKLLVGGTGNNQSISERNLAVWSDNGSAYDATFTMGSIVLVHPGQIALLDFIESDFAGVGSQPTVEYLLNEISGSFTSFSSKVYDPPQIYGTTITPTSYFPNRYYFLQSGALAAARHLQIKVDFGNTDTVQNEIFDLTIFGSIYIEK